jgi:hypothetical protein
MSRIYRVPYSGTLTNAGGNADLALLKPADDKPIRLAGWILGQTSEVKDAEEEILGLSVHHFAATVTDGSGGSSVTPKPNDPTVDPAAGFTARCNDTTVATTSGTDTTLEELAWNVRSSPWERFIPEEMRPMARQGEALVVRMDSTPADDISGKLTFLVEEM